MENKNVNILKISEINKRNEKNFDILMTNISIIFDACKTALNNLQSGFEELE